MSGFPGIRGHPTRWAVDRLGSSPGQVPRISAFYGITIWMYWNESHHARPHFHARYAGEAASVALDGEVMAGSLPRRALLLVADWAGLHRDERLANWERARRDEPLETIDPLA